MVSYDLAGKRAVVFGAARGMGKRCAIRLAQAGADVWAADLLGDLAEKTAAEIQALGVKAGSSTVDVTQREAVHKVFDEAAAAWGGIDIFVSSVGIWDEVPLEDLTEESLDKVMHLNVYGMIYGYQGAIKYMKETGGKIVLISSVAGRKGDSTNPAYYLSKAGVINLVKSMAMGGTKYNVTVNSVAPGYVRTAIWEHILDGLEAAADYKVSRDEIYAEKTSTRIPLKRTQDEDDIADMVLYLASPFAKNITGQTINVDGGIVML